ncbi:MAG: hypothetical protein ACRC5M_02665 [Anaeroplasmataceae bacterium]
MFKSIGNYELSRLTSKLNHLLEAKKYTVDYMVKKLQSNSLPLEEAINSYIDLLDKYDFDNLLPIHFYMLDILYSYSIITYAQKSYLEGFYSDLKEKRHNSMLYSGNMKLLDYLFNDIIANNFKINILECQLSDVCDSPDSNTSLYLPNTSAWLDDIKYMHIEDWKEDEEYYSEYLEDTSNMYSKMFSQDASMYILRNFQLKDHNLLIRLDELINEEYTDSCDNSHVCNDGNATVFSFSEDICCGYIPIELFLLTIIACYEATKGDVCIEL